MLAFAGQMNFQDELRDFGSLFNQESFEDLKLNLGSGEGVE